MKLKTRNQKTSPLLKGKDLSPIGDILGIGAGITAAVTASVAIPNVGIVIALPLAAGLAGIIHKCYTSSTN